MQSGDPLMRFYALTALVLALSVCAADAPKVEAVLASVASKNAAYPQFQLTLTNRGETSVTLVQPGDGSECGWRTPHLKWEWAAEVKRPTATLARCGNMNSLKAGEVFTLNPGESKVLKDWVHAMPPGPGVYKVKVTFINDPQARFGGVELGSHNVAEMAKVRASTPLSVESNTLDVTVAVPEAVK